jgi:hypothetical protein
MIRVYNILHGHEEIDRQLWIPVSDRRTRGHSMKLEKRHRKKNISIYSFASRVVNDWNSLPDQIVTSTSCDIFKRRLDDHWREAHFEY